MARQTRSPTPASEAPTNLQATLTSIQASLSALQEEVQGLTSLAAAAPPILATVADSLDSSLARAGAEGVDIEARSAALLSLLKSASEPETLAALSTLSAHLSKLTPLLTFLDDAPGLAATLGDTLDDYLRRYRDEGGDPEALLAQGGKVLRAAENGLRAASHTLAEGAAPPTPLETVRLLLDKDVRVALGVGLVVLKHIGAALQPAELGDNHARS